MIFAAARFCCFHIPVTLWPFSKSKRRRGADYDGKFATLRGFAIGGVLLTLLVAGVALIVLGLA